jgi:DNA polymerase III delta subunit
MTFGAENRQIKFYDFLDKEPKIDGLVVIEGTDSVLAQRALDVLIERIMPADMRALNLEVIDGPSTDDLPRVVADSVAAMPFLAERRVVAVRGCERLRAQPRRDLWAVAEAVPAGNTLVLEDLLAPNKKTKPEPYGALAGRKALRIDTTVSVDTRERYVHETLERLGAKAEPRVIAALAESDADLGSVGNDLEKLALTGKKITLAELENESLAIEDPKSWHYANALVEGRTSDASRWQARSQPISGSSGSSRGRTAASCRAVTSGASARCARSPSVSASAAHATGILRPCAASNCS